MISVVMLTIIVLAVLGALFALIGFLVGAKRGLARQLLALSLILLAIPVTILVAKAVSGMVSDKIWPMVVSYIPAEYLSALESSPSLMAFIEALPAALAAPLVFGVLFFVVLLVFKIFYAIIGRFKPFRRERSGEEEEGAEKKRSGGTLAGGALGIVAAAVVFVCMLMPAAGYLQVASEALSTLTDVEVGAPLVALLPEQGTLSAGQPTVVEGEDASTANGAIEMLAEINSAYVKPLAENPLVASVNLLGGRAMFNTLTSSRINDVKVNVLGEVTGVVNTVIKLEPMLGVDIKDFGEEQATALRSVVEDIDNSNILKNIFAEVLSTAATSWQNGESFLGIASPVKEDSPTMLKPVLDQLVNVLATSTADNIADDLYTIADVFGVLAENRTFTLLAGEMKAEEIIDALSTEGMLSEVLVAFKSNEHMEELIPAVINMGMTVIGEALGMPENDEAVYNSLMADMTGVINEALADDEGEILAEEIAEQLQDVAVAYGITFSDSLATFYAESIVRDFAPGETYTEAEVVGYFAEVSAYLAEQGEEAVPLSAVVGEEDGLAMLTMMLLGETSGEEAGHVAYDKLENKSEGQQKKEQAGSRVSFTRPVEPPVIEQSEKETTAMLSGEAPLQHSLVTREALLMDTTAIKELTTEQVKEDGDKITETLSVISDILAVLNPKEEPADPPAVPPSEGEEPVEPGEGDSTEGGDSGDQPTTENKPATGLGAISALNEAGLGAALGNLSSTNLLKDAAPQLLVGALQAGGVVLPKAETEEIIEIIKQDGSAAPDEGGETAAPTISVVESLVNSTADMLDMIDHIQQDNLSEEELIATIDKVFAGLTASTAKVVANVVQPSIITKYAPNISKSNAESCAKLIREVVLSIAEAEIEDYSAESALMSDLLHMVMKAKDSQAERLFTDVDGTAPGKMNITAKAFLDKVLFSDVIATAINGAGLGEDPFHVSENLKDADVADFVAAANALFAENAEHRDNAQRVLDFATLVGLQLSYDEASFTFTQAD